MPAATSLSAKGREGSTRGEQPGHPQGVRLRWTDVAARTRAPTRGAPTGAGGGGRAQGVRLQWTDVAARTRAPTRGAPTGAGGGGRAQGVRLRWTDVAARTRAPTRGAPTGAGGGERAQGCACGGRTLPRVRGHPQGVPLPVRAAGGGGRFGGILSIGHLLDCRHQVDEARLRRGGVAGAEPPHKGGPNRPDRPEM